MARPWGSSRRLIDWRGVSGSPLGLIDSSWARPPFSNDRLLIPLALCSVLPLLLNAAVSPVPAAGVGRCRHDNTDAAPFLRCPSRRYDADRIHVKPLRSVVFYLPSRPSLPRLSVRCQLIRVVSFSKLGNDDIAAQAVGQVYAIVSLGCTLMTSRFEGPLPRVRRIDRVDQPMQIRSLH